jgi:hypothetical protein
MRLYAGISEEEISREFARILANYFFIVLIRGG